MKIIWHDEYKGNWLDLATDSKNERCIPVTDIHLWEQELPYHGTSAYGEVLKRDIALAKRCNERGCEMVIIP